MTKLLHESADPAAAGDRRTITHLQEKNSLSLSRDLAQRARLRRHHRAGRRRVFFF